MRVFLDANILFSAAKSDGAVRALVRMLLDRRDQCWVDAYGVAQARRNLVTKGPQAIQVLDALLCHLQIAPALAGAVDPVELEWLPPFAWAAMRSSLAIASTSAARTDKTSAA